MQRCFPHKLSSWIHIPQSPRPSPRSHNCHRQLFPRLRSRFYFNILFIATFAPPSGGRDAPPNPPAPRAPHGHAPRLLPRCRGHSMSPREVVILEHLLDSGGKTVDGEFRAETRRSDCPHSGAPALGFWGEGMCGEGEKSTSLHRGGTHLRRPVAEFGPF